MLGNIHVPVGRNMTHSFSWTRAHACYTSRVLRGHHRTLKRQYLPYGPLREQRLEIGTDISLEPNKQALAPTRDPHDPVVGSKPCTESHTLLSLQITCLESSSVCARCPVRPIHASRAKTRRCVHVVPHLRAPSYRRTADGTHGASPPLEPILSEPPVCRKWHAAPTEGVTTAAWGASDRAPI